MNARCIGWMLGGAWWAWKEKEFMANEWIAPGIAHASTKMTLRASILCRHAYGSMPAVKIYGAIGHMRHCHDYSTDPSSLVHA
jgi:hypothetical protein